MTSNRQTARHLALVDLLAVDAQVAVPTQELLDTISWIRDHPSDGDSFSLRTTKGRLVVQLFNWPAQKTRGARRELSCVGRFPREFSASRQHIAELRGADFYDRATALTIADAGESLYVGKYWVWLYESATLAAGKAHAARAQPVDPEVEELIQRIRALDIQHSQNPAASASDVARGYERDATLVRLIKQLRGPACQICGGSFRKQDGGLYSECHHLEGLANSGFDVSSNILVLCATHHAQFHHGNVLIKEHTPESVTLSVDGVSHTCLVGPHRAPAG